ncbi:MAG: hypothetical protein ABIF85_06050 [Nanoarchaeota archaeon]|nr:hypothetical protein [Nanoarchaeota archaeon]MBU4300282.1 hypothetical protein [Nanoarchaeota archaeon]MBU4452505.1 hypothetical protein [Nanoarchaeota archaeon]MCG2723210.1 hypothetical protein [archaeon]
MALSKLRAYDVFLLSNSLLNFSTGLFYPFWIVFLQNFGGSIEQFGFSIGLMAFSAAIASYYAGKQSDTLGRNRY